MPVSAVCGAGAFADALDAATHAQFIIVIYMYIFILSIKWGAEL